MRIRYTWSMSDTAENMILRLLQDMRAENAAHFAEIAARDEKAQAQIGVLAEGLNGVKAELKAIRGHIQEIAMAVDHHTARLDRIDVHLGLDEPKH